MVSLGALEADSDAVSAAEASCSDKALAAAITARTEGLRQASEASKRAHVDAFRGGVTVVLNVASE